MEEAEARFEESLKIMTKSWTEDEPWTYEGEFWSCEDVVVEPPTAQQPPPPFWMGACSPASIDKIAEKIQKMRDAGVRYMLFSDGGSGIEGLRAFSKEIIPAFADDEDDLVVAYAAE